MTNDRWSAIINRIVAAGPEALDPLVTEGREEAPGRDFFLPTDSVLMPAAPMVRPDAVAVGVRVTEPLPDLVDRALRLAAFALEKDVEIVVLSHVDESGFERFGFRVERIAGDTPEARAECEDQIRRFWNIDLVL
ncbi:MAG TPA: hypothetical protein VK022_02290 [Paracoccaceae bacterium]|nr:hypothetical protein [Paracoccaceae bacterium]